MSRQSPKDPYTKNKYAQVIRELGAKKDELEVFNKVAEIISKSNSVDALCRGVLNSIFTLKALRVEKKGGIFLAADKEDILQLKISKKWTRSHIQDCKRVSYGNCLCGLAAQKRKIIISQNSRKDNRHNKRYQRMLNHGHIVLPLISDKTFLGILCLYLTVDTELSGEEIQLFKSIADIIAIGIKKIIYLREIRNLASFPQQNPYPVFEFNLKGELTYANNASKEFFKKCRVQIDDFIRENLPSFLESKEKKGFTSYQEVVLNKFVLGLYNHYLPGPKRVRIYAYDITKHITEHKRTLQKLQKSETGLREAQRIAHIGNWEWNIKDDTLTWSDEIFRIFQVNPRSFNGTYEEFLEFVHPEDREAVKEGIAKALYEKEHYSLDHRIILPDNTIKTVHERAEVFFVEDESPLRMVGTVQDITEIKKTETELKKLQDELETKVKQRTSQLEMLNIKLSSAKDMAESANRAKSSFLANMSHELRTPLNSVLGFSELLQNRVAGEINSQQEEYLKDIIDSANHLLSLINDILDLSKIESGMMNLYYTKVDIPMLVERSIALFKEKCMKHNIGLSINIENNIPGIEADERKIMQVLVNLLSNAVKFTPEGGKIFITAKKVKDISMPSVSNNQYFLEISVKDTGCGIKKEEIDSLFLPFQQLNSGYEKKYQGTGLGLALTGQIVELHNGRIRLEPGSENGATFVFTLPINKLKTGNDQNRNQRKYIPWDEFLLYLDRMLALFLQRNTPFGILQVSVNGMTSFSENENTFFDRLFMIKRSQDVISWKEPEDSLFVLLSNIDAGQVEGMKARFLKTLESSGLSSSIKYVSCPADGKTKEELLDILYKK